MNRVVITGIGAVTPIGLDIKSYTEGLQNGVSGARIITRFDASKFKTQFACEVTGFDAEPFIPRKEARRVDLYCHYGLASTAEAMADSGIDVEQVDLDRVGVIYGSGVGGLGSMQREISDFATGSGTPRYSPFMITQMITDMAAGMISIKYGFRGINYAVVSACATSTHALINAFDYIRLGKADIIISGGAEAAICETGIGGFNSMKALSTRNDDFKGASRPFDANRDGFVLGDGGGTIILEDYEHAKKRGAKIYGEVVGTGMTADAHHITAPHPDGLGAMRAMKLALEEAKLNPSDVDYINVHGTSTPLGDVAEINAIQSVFGQDAYGVNISSTKSMTGHLLGAAGAIEAIAGIVAMTENFVPPTINHHTADPNIDPKL
ncbi:UNVERIFIED_CONTAM: hypothetical protein GTU68_014443, partial [Idotea baltica]|nr:hypothetical protein [Idotea baltica]